MEMTEWAMQELLRNVLNGEADTEDLNVTWIETFEEAGVMTYNAGFVIKCESGREFQITIVDAGGSV